jgi:hypothetical protein
MSYFEMGPQALAAAARRKDYLKYVSRTRWLPGMWIGEDEPTPLPCNQMDIMLETVDAIQRAMS